MASDKKVGDTTALRDPVAMCPLVPGRTKGDCPDRCRGCNFRAAAVAGEVLRKDQSAGVCPRVPHRMKYTCSGKCPGCGAKQLQSLSSSGDVK